MLNVAMGFAEDSVSTAATTPAEKELLETEQKKTEAEQKKEKAVEEITQQAQSQDLDVAEKDNTEQPNNVVADIQNTLNFLKILVYVLAALIVGLLVFIVVNVLNKKSQRDNVVKIVTESERLKVWRDEIKIDTSKFQSATPLSSYQPVKIDEQQFKQLFEACWANKQSVSANTSQEQFKPPVPQNQPQSFYADAIIDGKFNRVKETADENETNFELKLNHASDTTAKVIVYQGAYRRILANPSFLDGCEKQLIGNNYTSVAMIKEGIAQKDSDGKWHITTTPEVKIS
jgi:hypothetical protein